MKDFKVLIVDDDPEWAETFCENLHSVDLAHLAGPGYTALSIVKAANQAEAERAALTGDDDAFDLVLLDLRYPLEGAAEVQEVGDSAFQGMVWLPSLRRLQPDATIVILTSFAAEVDLRNVVAAIRDCNANDFIPKTAPFRNIVARIGVALQQARRTVQLASLQKEFRELLRSRAARVYAEDVGTLLRQTSTSLTRIASTIENDRRPGMVTAAEGIRTQVRAMNHDFLRLTECLEGGGETIRQVDMYQLVRHMVLLYEGSIERARARLQAPNDGEKLTVRTYEGDLRIAIHEVLVNSIQALAETQRCPADRKLAISVSEAPGGAILNFTDGGDGFSDQAMKRMFERGYSGHGGQGLGLYIAKRMMQQLGGKLSAKNGPQGGAEVSLFVKDLDLS